MSTTRNPPGVNAQIERARTRAFLLAIFLGTVLAWSAHAEQGHAQHEHGTDSHEAEGHEEHGEQQNDAVRLSTDVLDEFGIQIVVAGPGRIGRTITLPAEVRANEDRLAHITPRFAGIVKSVHKKIGDRVEPAGLLATIESSESLARYSLATDIAGVVIAKHVTLGEAVTPETLAFVVADLRDVWVDISAYQKDFDEVRMGQRVLVSAGHGRAEAEGSISYISPVVDEETRTATARVVLPNPDHVWRPGMFVTARVLVEDTEVPVAVPRTALEVVEGETVVFVETDDGLAPRSIRMGREDSVQVEVVSGLRSGERYVAQGGFTLKAELARDELSGGHSH